MRYNKVFLISPESTSRYGGLRLPAGIGYIAQALYDENIDYDFIDMRIGYSYRQLRKKVIEYQPDLIGVSMITLEYKKAYNMMWKLKEEFPNIPIVVGGHHLTILKSKVLEECDAIDFGVVGDGEEVIVELCQDKIPIEEILGLCHKKDGEIVFNGMRYISKTLDQYSFPQYIGFNLKDYSDQITVMSTRGCVEKCTFCPNVKIGGKFRKRSVERFVDEIEFWRNKGYKQFAFDDDNFTLIYNRVFEICDEIERRGLNDLMIRCSNGIRADRVDRKMLTRMMEVGVREVGFGVDGGNDRVLRLLKKGENLETIEKALKTACEVGLDVKAFIIIGTPGETEDDIRDSINLAQKYPIARVNFNNAIPYPGTEMYEIVKNNNYFIIPPEEYLNNTSEEMGRPVFQTPQLSAERWTELAKECHEIECQVMKRTAIRMFKNVPLAKFFIWHFFNVDLFEKLFFKNLFLRRIFEIIRYNKLMARRIDTLEALH